MCCSISVKLTIDKFRKLVNVLKPQTVRIFFMHNGKNSHKLFSTLLQFILFLSCLLFRMNQSVSKKQNNSSEVYQKDENYGNIIYFRENYIKISKIFENERCVYPCGIISLQNIMINYLH